MENENFQPWTADGDDFCRALDAPRDADPVQVLGAFLWDLEGIKADQLTDKERVALLRCVYFLPMYSVVKSNWDDLGEDALWHTEGHGKRCRPTWWFENRGRWLVDDVAERLRPSATPAPTTNREAPNEEKSNET